MVQLAKKNINDKKFWNYFKYQNPSFLSKDLTRATHAKNEHLVNNINDEQIDLRNTTNNKEIHYNENLDKIADLVEKILGFNKQ